MTASLDVGSLRCDIRAEQVVLGGCLWTPVTLAAVRTIIDAPEVFARPGHELLYAALCAAADAGEPTDAVGIWRAIAPNRIPGIDGAYLHSLLEACPTPPTAVYHAADIAKLARLRHWQQIASRLLERASAPDADSDELDIAAWRLLEDAVNAHERQRYRAADALGRRHNPVATPLRPGRPPGYAAAALRGELDRVLTATGSTSRQLAVVRAAAASLARLVTDRSLTADLVTDALTTAGTARGLDAGAVAAAIHAGLHHATTTTDRRTA